MRVRFIPTESHMRPRENKRGIFMQLSEFPYILHTFKEFLFELIEILPSLLR